MKIASIADALCLRLKQGAVWRLLVIPGQRRWLDITPIEVFTHGLADRFDGYRIVQFSDLHLDGVMMTRARLQQLVARINEQQPDLIVFTGDFVTKAVPFRSEDLIEPLRDLTAPDGVVAVMGNHDHRVAPGLIGGVMAESGMINLNNAVHTIRRGDCRLHVAGVDSLARHSARLDLVLRDLPDDGGAAILMAHEPEFADVSAATKRFALQLSGHTHGGQINIPLLTRLLVSGYSLRRISGAVHVGEMLLYINRGIGTVNVPLRFRSNPEITVITLRAGTPDALSDSVE